MEKIAHYIPIDGQIIFPLMVLRMIIKDKLTFKVYNKKNFRLGIEIKEINQEFIFSIDMILGNAINPVKNCFKFY